MTGPLSSENEADDAAGGGAPEAEFTTGILPSQAIRAAIAAGEIDAEGGIADDQIQPASLDLRLGAIAYRVRASFLPGKTGAVMEKVAALSLYTLDLGESAVLEKDCIYIVPLLEHLALGRRMSAIANPKSSTGRLDIFARLITDRGTEFDRVRERYRGPLYAEISPRAFSIRVRQGSRLVQLRLKRGSPAYSDTFLRRLHSRVGLVDAAPGEENIKNGLAFTVDVSGDGGSGPVGYKARRHAAVVDVDKRDFYEPEAFWEPVYGTRRGIILDPNDFYILASKEAVTIPANYAAEMLAYDTLVGEFRVHYAGFFDPGFGDPEAGAGGTRAVLEVRSHEVPFLVEDGQIVGRLIYERLTAKPDRLYGATIGSSYQRQRLALSKQFKRP